MNALDNQYATLLGAVQGLTAQGYTDELTLNDEGLQHNACALDPALFSIDSFHRMEGPSDPADMSIVYAISSKELELKGLLVGGYGANAQSCIDKMLKRLPAQHHLGLVQPVHAIATGASVKV